jgi:uncharacterized protein YjbI with pentapeptide repeats
MKYRIWTRAPKPELSRRDIIVLLARLKSSEDVDTSRSRPAIMRLRGVRLPGIDLSGLDLSFVDFSQSDLRGAKLNDAVCLGTYFFGSNLDEADLSNAILEQAQFGYATLRRAILRGSNFGETKFRSTEASDADFSGSVFRQSYMVDSNFTRAKFIDCQMLGVCMEDNDWTGVKATGGQWDNLRDARNQHLDLRTLPFVPPFIRPETERSNEEQLTDAECAALDPDFGEAVRKILGQ